MSARSLVRDLFAEPGAAAERTRHLLAQAAAAHARLLDSTRANHPSPVDGLREALASYLRGSAPAAEKRWVLDDPQLVEALHGLSGASRDLAAWDAAVADGSDSARPTRKTELGIGRLGNVVAAVRLRRARAWCGTMVLASDDYGRVHLPFSDWALVLAGENAAAAEPLDGRAIVLDLTGRLARWSLGGIELVRMPRATFEAMFVDNCAAARSEGVEFCGGPPWVRFERAAPLGRTRIRFEPISATAARGHAELTGGIVATLLAAIEQNAAHIHSQLCQCIRTIQGFELPPHEAGHVASFSVPTSPGIIGLNVAYTKEGRPRLSPYAFMWLGHELGHTLHYLIDDVAFAHGWRFLENPHELTPALPRYGRQLRVGTLLQIPYVHLFEWWLLVRFFERGFAGLPWRMFEDAGDVAADVRAEIAESFDAIDQYARLTETGRVVVARMRALAAEADARWRF